MLSCPQSPLLCSSDPQQGPWVVAAASRALISPFFFQKIQRIQKRKENAALQNCARKPRCCLYLWRAERPCTRCKARQSRTAPSPRGAQEQLDPSPATGEHHRPPPRHSSAQVPEPAGTTGVGVFSGYDLVNNNPANPVPAASDRQQQNSSCEEERGEEGYSAAHC